MNDLCSLYVDDTAIFLSDILQLTAVLAHIRWVGMFTGLQLNVEKTIAFDPAAASKLEVAGVTVRAAPVKYLGAFLGFGDLSKLNFEIPLWKMRMVMSHWRKHHLTLDARILVIKTFLFLVFVHILNTVYISNNQLDLIQKLLNDFLWRGWNKVKQSVMVMSLSLGGMQMLHVKNVVHGLYMKWFQYLMVDSGLT